MVIDSWRNKQIVILGFGREGQSTLQFLRNYFPKKLVHIADINEQLPIEFSHIENVVWITGPDYLGSISEFDIVIKSPGISLKAAGNSLVTSQTDIFLQLYRKQTIGVTGTKGKSTTSSLIAHIIKQQTDNVIFIGNIGVPPLSKISQINEQTLVVQEISAHQLEHIKVAPHIAILLNLFEEHLDHFKSSSTYFSAKENILLRQKSQDFSIINADPELNGSLNQDIPFIATVRKFAINKTDDTDSYVSNNTLFLKAGNDLIPFSLKRYALPGSHNQLNAMAAIIATQLAGIGVKAIQQGLDSFEGLPHRMAFVATKAGVSFYNDSISTVPETTIRALETLTNVKTLILGGKDRSLNYEKLYKYLSNSSVGYLIFTGPAGKRMMNEYTGPQQMICLDDMGDIIRKAFEHTPKNAVCLLSPAASSYDKYTNFEARGKAFENAIKNTSIS